MRAFLKRVSDLPLRFEVRAVDELVGEARKLLASLRPPPDPRLGGITADGISLYEKRMDDLGIPREEYAAQAGGTVTFTFWGRVDRALEMLAALEGVGPAATDGAEAEQLTAGEAQAALDWLAKVLPGDVPAYDSALTKLRALAASGGGRQDG